MQPLRGILLKVSSVCVFMIMASLIKATADHVPPGQAVFFRSFFATPVILVGLLWRHELKAGLRTDHPVSHFFRGVVGVTAMGLSFAGLGLLPLPEVTAIGYASPLLVVVFAAMFLNEKVGLFRLSTVALGMSGVLIVLSPRLEVGSSAPDIRETLGAVVVLGGAMFGALAAVFVRKMVQTETTSAIVFWFSITASVLSLLTIPWGWVMPGWKEVVMLIAAGVFGGMGQLLMTASYRYADASLIAPFDYTSMLLALGVGYFIFGETPTLAMLLGGSIIVAAGVLVIWRERQLGIERGKGRRTIPNNG